MSKFINGGVGLTVTIHASDDRRACDECYHGMRPSAIFRLPVANEQRVAANTTPRQNFRSRWWPRSGSIIGGWSGSADDMFLNLPAQWIAPVVERGANGRLGFVGYTRDQYGSALGGCTVRLYRVSTEEQVAKVTSDANGLYFATTPYSDEHFLVIHNTAGTLAGATKTSLLPA